MSVLKQKRTTSKAEFINTANQIYVETLNFLTRLSARYSRLIAEPVAKLAFGRGAFPTGNGGVTKQN
jgi:hypothetical protein